MLRHILSHTRRHLAAPAIVGLSLGAGCGLGGAVSAQASTLRPRVAVADSRPQLGAVHVMGIATPDTPAEALVSIQHRDEAGLLRFITAVSTPGTAVYGHYLTARQFDQRYAPSEATVTRVKRFLGDFGLRVASVPANRAFILVSGSVAGFSRAFAARIDFYIKDGQIFHSPVTGLTVPRSLSGVITGITGLDNGDILTPQLEPTTETSVLDTPPYPAYVNAPPFSSYFDSSPATQAPGYGGASTLGNVVQGYTPAQIEGAYGISKAIADGLNGTGETVAVIDAYSSPTIDQDVDEWSSLHGLPAPDLVINDTALEREQPDGPEIPTDVPVLGGLDLLDPSGWFGEETLDIEAVHTMAPGARIIMQGADSPEDVSLEQAQNDVVMADQAQEVSNSYAGTGDSTNSTSDGYWEQAAAEGMGVQFSTGDDGDNTDGETDLAGQSVDTDPNSPYVTAVGGTTLAIGAENNYQWETYWGDNTATLSDGKWGTLSFDGGGGGGVSQVYPEPSWQKAVVPSSLANYWKTYQPENSSDDAALTPCSSSSAATTAADGCAVYPGRAMPDVAMLADPNTGFQLGLSEDFSVYANLDSIALPTDTDAYSQFRIGGTSLASPLFAGMMALADQANGKPLGFADPALYSLFAKDSGAFHTIDSKAPVPGVVRTNYTNSTNAAGGTTTVLRTFDDGYTLSTAAGYNDSTGLGSPNGMAFICGISSDSALARSVPGSPCGSDATGPRGTGAAKACAAKVLSYAQHPAASTREVRAVVYVDNRKVKTVRGHAITRVSVARPTARRFTVRYVSYLANGEIVSHVIAYNGCSSRQSVKVLHAPLR